jgi:hypothetical protein
LNKYKRFSRNPHKERSCDKKKKFSSEEEAFQAGMKTYLCKYCESWHRANLSGKKVVGFKRPQQAERLLRRKKNR